jgi:hypothetical protein
VKFDIQPDFLPSAVIYVPKQGVYSVMIGTFDGDNIKKFMDDFAHGKITQYKVTLSDGDFNKEPCEMIQEKILNGKFVSKF